LIVHNLPWLALGTGLAAGASGFAFLRQMLKLDKFDKF
jgi:hypothetical protein